MKNRKEKHSKMKININLTQKYDSSLTKLQQN